MAPQQPTAFTQPAGPWPAPPQPVQPRRKHGALIAGIAALAVVALAVGAFVLFAPASLKNRIPLLSAPKASSDHDDTLRYGAMVASDGSFDYYYRSDLDGIVRTTTGTSNPSIVVSFSGQRISNVSNLLIEGEYLFFSIEKHDNGEHYEIHRVKTNGTDNQTVYTFDASNSPALTFEHLDELYIHNDSLYVITDSFGIEKDPIEVRYQLIRMDLDGQNQQNLALIQSNENCNIYLTPDKLYYISYTPEDRNKLYEMNLDGTEFRQVFQSSFESIRGLFRYKGRLYFTEASQDGTQASISSVNTSGGDYQTLYSVSQTDQPRKSVSLRIASNDTVYFLEYYNRGSDDDAFVAHLVGISLKPGNEKTVDATLPYISSGSNIMVSNVGDRFLLINDPPSSEGYRAILYAIDYSGNVTTY